MKFKAILTDHGVNLLEKRFVPSLDKIGRICHLYLTRDHAIFLHNLLNGDGIQSIAQFRKETLFEDYRISSQNDDRIAFAIDLGLLHRALRSSLTIEGGDRLQIKLVKKLPPGSPQPMPFLTFETKVFAQMPGSSEYSAVQCECRCELFSQIIIFAFCRLSVVSLGKPTLRTVELLELEKDRLSFQFDTFFQGYKSAVIQDVPISKPLSRSDVVELQGALDMAQDMPQTLVQVPDLIQLQNLVDRLKHVGDLLDVSITQYGDLHLQVSTSLITVGSEFRKLRILGIRGD